MDIIIGKGPSARTIQLDLPPFTLIAATTSIAMISAPLRSTILWWRFQAWNSILNDELGEIVKRAARILEIEIEPAAIMEIATRSDSRLERLTTTSSVAVTMRRSIRRTFQRKWFLRRYRCSALINWSDLG